MGYLSFYLWKKTGTFSKSRKSIFGMGGSSPSNPWFLYLAKKLTANPRCLLEEMQLQHVKADVINYNAATWRCQLVKLLPSQWLDASKDVGKSWSPKKGREYPHVASSMVGLLVVPYMYVLMCSVLLLIVFGYHKRWLLICGSFIWFIFLPATSVTV